MVVAAGDNEAAGVRLIGGDDAHAGHEVGVAIHAVHLRVAPVLTTGKETRDGLPCFRFTLLRLHSMVLAHFVRKKKGILQAFLTFLADHQYQGRKTDLYLICCVLPILCAILT